MSMLKQENVVRLISLTNEMKSAEEEKDKLVLRSIILTDIFYELVRIRNDTYIFVCSISKTQDLDSAERLFCCWANGDVVCDGIWFKELEECLPHTYQSLCKIYHQMKADNGGYDIKMVNVDQMEIYKLNNRFLTNHIFAQSDVIDFFNTQRYRY